MKLTAHTIFKNEERYLWYSVKSVVDEVDELLLWDTGSSDRSLKIAQNLVEEYPRKIFLNQVRQGSSEEFTKIRSQMLEKTDTDWVLIVDADEVWWLSKIKKLRKIIEGRPNLQTVASHYKNIIGDIFHYQPEKAGRYKIGNVQGHVTIRAMSQKNIKELHVAKPHGQQGFFDANKTLIQDLPQSRRAWIPGDSYLHFTHMIRSQNRHKDNQVTKRSMKYKYEIGKSFARDFFYPEAFFYKRPEFVPCVWSKMRSSYKRKSYFFTLLRKVKRVFPIYSRGY